MEAMLLGMHHSQYQFESLACAVLVCSRAWIASFFSYILSRVDKHELEAHVVFEFFMADETTLQSGRHEWRPEGGSTEDGPLKMHQVELVIGLLLKDTASGKWCLLTIPVNHPLQACDSGSGETYWAMWRETLDYCMGPAWGILRTRFRVRVQCRTLDRAGPNLRAVRKCEVAAPDDLHITMPCDAHAVSTTTGRTLLPVQGMLTGIIALSLSMRLGGHFTAFRKILAAVILKSVIVVRSAPLACDHAWSRRRDALLRLTLPPSSTRISVLRSLLTGDITDGRIQLYRPSGAGRQELKEYAESLASALVPSRLAVFSRTRWLTSSEPIADLALLANTHDLLQRAVIAWCSNKTGSAQLEELLERLDDHAPEWDAIPSDSEDGEKDDKAAAGPGDQCAASHVAGAAGSIDWAAFNKKQRRDSMKFVQKNPAGILTTTCIAIQPLIALQRRVEFLDGDVWQTAERKKAISGKAFNTRMEYVASLEGTEKFYEHVRSLMGPHASWELLPRNHMTVAHSGTALSMLAISMCGIAQLLHWPHSGYPVKLFRLVKHPHLAASVFSDCVHMRDRFTEGFLKIFSTPELLAGSEARAYLFGLSTILRKSTQRIECRHAAIRRRIGTRFQLKREPFQSTSAAYFLMRQRILEHSYAVVGSSAADKARARKPRTIACGKYIGHRTGGGGKRRAAFSELLTTLNAGGRQSNEVKSRVFRQAHAAARGASEEQTEIWQRIGEAGTASHAAGAKSFGEKRAASQLVDGRRAKRSRTFSTSDPLAAHAAGSYPTSSAALHTSLAVVLQTSQAKSWEREVEAEVQRRADELQQNREDHSEICLWVQDRTVQADGCPGASTIPREGAAALPVADLDMSWVDWCPPAKQMAEMCLRGNRYQTAFKYNLRQVLSKEWKRLHFGFRHAMCPPLGEPSPPAVALCRDARICLCTDDGKACKALVNDLLPLFSARSATGWLRKKTVPRKLYNNGQFILRVYNSDGVATSAFPSTEDVWILVAFGNLNTSRFACLVFDFVPSSTTSQRQAVLTFARNIEPCTLWQALYDFAGSVGCAAELWTFASTAGSVSRFAPGRRVEASLVQPRFSHLLRSPRAPAAAVALRRFAVVPYVPPGGGLWVHLARFGRCFCKSL